MASNEPGEHPSSSANTFSEVSENSGNAQADSSGGAIPKRKDVNASVASTTPTNENLMEEYTTAKLEYSSANASLKKQLKAKLTELEKRVVEAGMDMVKESIANNPRPQSNLSEATEDLLNRSLRLRLTPVQKRTIQWGLWREQKDPAGGIIASVYGSGKRVSMLAMILASPKPAKPFAEEPENPLQRDVNNMTLIVCKDVTTLSIWKQVLESHWKTGGETLRVCDLTDEYVASVTPESLLMKADVALTTYKMVADIIKTTGTSTLPTDGPNGDFKNVFQPPSPKRQKFEYQPRGQVLLKMKFHRIIIDNAEMIKNPVTLKSLTVSLLPSDIRWVLGSNLVQNSESDLYPYLRFLRVSPFDHQQIWKQLIQAVAKRDHDGISLLVPHIVLREENSATDEDKQHYSGFKTPMIETKLVRLLDSQINAYASVLRIYRKIKNRSEKATKSPMTPFALLSHLKMICCHPPLLKFDPAAFSQVRELVGARELDDLFSSPIFNEDFVSPKLAFIVGKVREAVLRGERSVIASQYTQVLGKLEHLFKAEPSIRTHTLCSSSKENGYAEVREFNSSHLDRGPHVMLVTFKTGEEALTFYGASNLYFADLHWNPALEDKLIDRVCGFKQNKNVRVYRVVSDDTIEQQIMNLHEKKRELGRNLLAGVKGSKVSAEGFKLSVSEMEALINNQMRDRDSNTLNPDPLQIAEPSLSANPLNPDESI